MVAAVKHKRTETGDEILIRLDRLDETDFKCAGQLLVDLEATARALGVPSSDVVNWCAEGYLPEPVEVCGRKLFIFAEVMRWVADRCPKLRASVEENIAHCRAMQEQSEGG